MSLNSLTLAKIFTVVAIAPECLFGQPTPFNSGSTGADGALNYPTPGTYYFNPTALGINPSGNNIFNFTTINIASGVQLIVTSQILAGPIYWLASGDVNISGDLFLDGSAGHNASNNVADRIPSASGAGGFGGGVAGGGGLLPSPGNGPGGGAAATSTVAGGNGTYTGNQYLVPLIGGSGGGGSLNGGVAACGTTYGGGGGAGGGAILIASSTMITLIGPSGRISARGGNATCDNSGYGSGGSIRLVSNAVNANCVSICPSLDVTTPGSGNSGRIRIEAFSGNFASSIVLYGPHNLSVPFALALPATGPAAIKVTSINGISINANPFSFPDATINTTGPVIINVQAQYIPVGTFPKIYVYGETGPDQTITCSALTGTLQQSTCSTSITFVTGGSRGFVKATW